MLVSNEIHYEVEGGEELLTLLNTFATSLGWTADVWTGSQLQLYSPGYTAQNLVYRFQTSNLNVQADAIIWKGVTPAGRGNAFSVVSSDCYAPNRISTQTTHSRISVPTSPFTVYLFGTSTFLAMVLHVSPTLIFTIAVGLPNLFRGWRAEEDNLGMAWSSGGSFNDTHYWYNAESQLNLYYLALTSFGQNNSESIIYLNGIGGEDQSHYRNNYHPTYSSTLDSNISGVFNKMPYFLNYNAFSGRRSAFYPTLFLKHLTDAIWYPLGLLPCAYIHGYGLQIGQELSFGNEKFLVFPSLSYSQKIWQAWRIE